MTTNVVQASTFRYEPPEIAAGKTRVPLCQSDILQAYVLVAKEGGERPLHLHTGIDQFWFVLQGRARFYGDDNSILAELGKGEGIFVPRGCKYWFETTDEQPLELLRVAATAQKEPDEMLKFPT